MKNRIKIISVLAVLSLTLTLFAGCKTTKNSSEDTTIKESVKVDKNAKLRIFAPDNGGVKGYEPGATESNNQFLNAIREKTGYKNLEWTIYNSGGANSQDKLNMLFASGEQIDMVILSGLDMFKYFQTQGMLNPLDDIIKKVGPEVAKRVSSESWSMVTIENKKYGIPIPFYETYNKVDLGPGLLARQDWMDKLGLKAPKNTDELYTFMKTIKEKDPSGKGTIPYVAAAGNDGNPVAGLDPIMAAFGLSVPYNVKDGKLVATDDLYLKNALEYLNKLYKEGLLDNEYLFNKTAQLNEKVGSGKAALVQGSYWDVKSHVATLTKTTPEAKLNYLPLIEGKNGQKGLSRPTPSNAIHFIPKTAKYPTEAVDLLNCYLSDNDLQAFINFGKEGVHYEKKNGVLSPIQPAYDSVIYKIYFRPWRNAEIWAPLAVLAGYEPAMKSYSDLGPQLTVFNINHYKPTLEVEASKAKTLGDLRKEYIAKIISGALPLSALDEYFKKADAAGRQEVLKANQDWFNKDGKAIYELLNKK
jgi:putative aldouronate transport system substrate-binding protein